MIYFVRDTISGLVKIGTSENPWLRLCKMQSDSPGELTLLGVLEGGVEVERELHVECAAQRVRGEWFRHEGPVIAAIARAAPFIRPDVLRRSNPRQALIIELSAATGQSANSVRSWLERGRVPTWHVAAVARAGVISIAGMVRAAAENSVRRGGRKVGDPLKVTLEEIARAEARAANTTSPAPAGEVAA